MAIESVQNQTTVAPSLAPNDAFYPTIYPSCPGQPSNHTQETLDFWYPNAIQLYGILISIFIGSFIVCRIKKLCKEANQRTTQQDSTTMWTIENSAQPETSEDLLLSLSDRKLFLANALKTEKYKSSGSESSSFRKVIQISTHESCAICLEKYHDEDDVCASPNHACSHMFHRDCIMDWLLTHEICPVCRRDYLQLDIIRSTHAMRDDVERGDVIDPSDLYAASTRIENVGAENPSLDDPMVEMVSTSINSVDLHQSINGNTAPSSMDMAQSSQITI